MPYPWDIHAPLHFPPFHLSPDGFKFTKTLVHLVHSSDEKNSNSNSKILEIIRELFYFEKLFLKLFLKYILNKKTSTKKISFVLWLRLLLLLWVVWKTKDLGV